MEFYYHVLISHQSNPESSFRIKISLKVNTSNRLYLQGAPNSKSQVQRSHWHHKETRKVSLSDVRGSISDSYQLPSSERLLQHKWQGYALLCTQQNPQLVHMVLVKISPQHKTSLSFPTTLTNVCRKPREF